MRNLLAIFSALLLLLPVVATADDVDIYISAPVALPQPNILFVLDESGSMRRDEDNNNASSSGKESRMQQLKDAMHQIITNDELNKINAGIMSYTTNPYDINDVYLPIEHNFADASLNSKQTSLLAAVNNLTPTGGTPTARAINKAIKWMTGSANFTSPIEYSCQKHRIILLTDGVATWSPYSTNPFDSSESCEHGYPHEYDIPSASDYNDLDGVCSKEMIGYGYKTDFISGGADTEGNPYDGKQNIVVDTIGFHTEAGGTTYARDFLQEIIKGQNETLDDAAVSEGGYYTANSVDSLVQVFSTLLTQAIISTEIAYTAPTIPVNSDNGAINKNEFYIPLFKPEFRAFWKGNLKKYRIEFNETLGILEIKDRYGNDVLTSDLAFETGTSSYWSDGDGADPLAGGVAAVVNTQERTIYTNNGTDSSLVELTDLELSNIAPSGTATQGSTSYGGAASRAIDGDTDGTYNNGSVTHTSNNSSSNWWRLDLGELKDDLESIVIYNRTDCCQARLNGFRLNIYDQSYNLEYSYTHSGSAGDSIEINLPNNTSGRYVYIDANGSNHLSLAEVEVYQKVQDYGWFVDAQTAPADTDDGRMGAPIHGAPVIYQKSAGETIVFIAGSDGVLHAFSDTGSSVTELWGFIPDELVGLLDDFKQNIETDDQNSIVPPKYGLDGPLKFFELKNSSGVVTKRLLVVGMRRGGRNYYAIDVTNVYNPSLAWVIEGGVGDFAKLGQTWGTPQLTKLRLAGNNTHVLIIPGGYDAASQDDYLGARRDDSMGNAIYIVNAETGAELRTISSSGADLNISDMRNSIAADVALIDINGNGFTNRLYAAGTGGRIFRVDFSSSGMTGDVIANVSGTTAATNRRFFNRPVIGYMGRYLAITIGSGMRPNIYDTTVRDRFYMIKDFDVWRAPADGPDPDTDPDYYTVNNSDLRDTSTDIGATGGNYGWYFDLQHTETETDGSSSVIRQKSITKSVIFDSVIYFSTVSATREDVDVSCTPVVSSSRSFFYAVNIEDSSAVYKTFDNNDSMLDEIDDRSRELQSTSLPTSPFIFIDSSQITGDDGSTINRPLGFFPIAPGIGEETIIKENNYSPIYWESSLNEY